MPCRTGNAGEENTQDSSFVWCWFPGESRYSQEEPREGPRRSSHLTNTNTKTHMHARPTLHMYTKYPLQTGAATPAKPHARKATTTKVHNHMQYPVRSLTPIHSHRRRGPTLRRFSRRSPVKRRASALQSLQGWGEGLLL
jgi:hypothetical protein